MDAFHDKDYKIAVPFSASLNENISRMETIFENCGDYVKRKLQVGGLHKAEVYLAYTDNLINRQQLEYSVLRNLQSLTDIPFMDPYNYIKETAVQTVDIKEADNMDDAVQAVLSGDIALFVDGYAKAMLLSFRTFPLRGVTAPELETTIKGAKDSFTENMSFNRALIRRRIKDTNLKMESYQAGIRSRTNIAIAYIKGIVQDGLVDKIKEEISAYTVDGIFDVGMLEQLASAGWHSPFPKFQTTERPDKASSALLEGRVAVIVDNSPMVLLLPADISVFFQASDDYYRSYEVVSFIRILRYIGAFLAVGLPGLYIAVTNYQTELIPTPLVLSLAADRQGVPFSIVFEVLLLQLAFEMLTEAGIRLPSPMGNTIGIVGGLIIGDAAISANLVSPMAVIVVAFTAIASFMVPNETFSSAFRLIRYFIILLSALFGLFGFVIGMLCICIHLAGLKSYGIPYLVPFAAKERQSGDPLGDSILKFPLTKQIDRPLFARREERVRVKKNEKGR